jgi:hypothetical protein
MKKTIITLVALTLGLMLAASLQAQVRTPQPSPTASFTQSVGLTEITLDYSRPGVKDRTIYGDLVPYGEIWRTGANRATKFTFGEDVKLGGQDVEAGSYAVLTVPGKKEWKVNLYPHESTSFGSYVEMEPAVSFMVTPKKTNHKVETFTIEISNVRDDKATIDLVWENTRVEIPLEVHTEKQVMATIDKALAGPSMNDYYQAATYYHSSGKDLDQALEWVKMVNKDNARYWTVRREALIQADLGNKKEAIAAAKKSLDMAKEAGDNNYVRMNEASIKEWSK